MKVTIFGATGETGKWIINEASKRGINVTVFARLNRHFQNSNIRVIRGDLYDKSKLTEAIHGSDAVLSVLGPTSPKHPNDLPITRATEAIISVMEQENVKRFIAISTGTAADPGDSFDFKIWLPKILIKIAMPNTYKDIIGLANAIRASNLDWTMVRVAVLKNRPATQLNEGLYGHSKHSLTISRENVAKFMLDQLSTKKFIKQAPGISSL